MATPDEVLLAFTSLDPPHGEINVRISAEVIGAGGQGRVFKASVNGDETYCVKELPGIPAGETAAESVTFSELRKKSQLTLLKDSIGGGLRESLVALDRYLPLALAFDSPPGSNESTLLFLRRRCEGTDLQQLLTDKAKSDRVHLVWRLELARKMTQMMVGLRKYGFIHLDPYPDNIFVEGDGAVPKIALIDLEGVGVLQTRETPTGKKYTNQFARKPKAYGKEDIWPLPWWFPTPDQDGIYSKQPKYAADWQALSIVLRILTWGGIPGCWLTNKSINGLEEIAQRVRNEGRKPTDSEKIELGSLLAQSDSARMELLVSRCGSLELSQFLVGVFADGFLGPLGDGGGNWFLLSDLQKAINRTRSGF